MEKWKIASKKKEIGEVRCGVWYFKGAIVEEEEYELIAKKKESLFLFWLFFFVSEFG